jgi:hypothetical protein
MPSSVVCKVIVWLLVEDVMPPYSVANDMGVFGFDTALVLPFEPEGAPVWTVFELFWAAACALIASAIGTTLWRASSKKQSPEWSISMLAESRCLSAIPSMTRSQAGGVETPACA